MAKFRKKPVVIEAFRLNERGLIAEDWFWDAVTRNEMPVIAENNVSIKSVINRAVINAVLDLVGESKIKEA